MRKPASRAAFTLLELLVTMALLAFLLVAVLKIINHSLSISSRTGAALEVRRTGRDVIGVIRRDLSLAMQPGRGHALAFAINPPPHEAPYANADTVFWQVPINKANAWGNVAVVGYFVQHDLSANPNGPRYQLRRFYAEPEEPGAEVAHRIYSHPDDWTPAAARARFAPATAAADLDQAQRGWVADGVLGLWVRALDAQGREINQGNASFYQYDSRPPADQREALPSRLPAAVEITLVCLAPRDLPRLRTVAALPAIPLDTSGEAPSSVLHTTVERWAQTLRNENPGVDSITVFHRRLRIYQGE